jgi:hypothetical protein
VIQRGGKNFLLIGRSTFDLNPVQLFRPSRGRLLHHAVEIPGRHFRPQIFLRAIAIHRADADLHQHRLAVAVAKFSRALTFLPVTEDFPCCKTSATNNSAVNGFENSA